MDPRVSATTGWELLRRSLSRGRLAHGYLFSGDDLDVLESAAEQLARVLNCQHPTERAPGGLPLTACGSCTNCRRIESHNHSDVTWVYPENKSRQISADQTREVVRLMGLRSMESPYKIAVFVAADRMNTTAANIFLKTLEEPPAGAVLILLSTEPGRLLETVVSRCQRLSFGVGSVRMDEPVLQWLAEFGQRAAGDSAGVLARYHLLDSLLAALASARGQIEERLEAASPLKRYPDAEPAQQERWEDQLAASIEAEYRRRRGEFLAGLQAWLRDVWLATQGIDAGLRFLPGDTASISAVAARLKPSEARANLESWETTQRLLHTNVQEALALEVGLLKLQL
jgi:DNA polymerase III subunit delta'